ncbi:MAG: T9SS type A sorting domain-containing protein [Chitinophagaceae bacterium]
MARIFFLNLFSLVFLLSARSQSQTTAKPDDLGTLPVMFDSVRAVVRNDQVQIAWCNLTERDVSYYQVERSADGKEFQPVYRFEPAHNLNAKANYSFTDGNAIPGNSYYRIRVMIQTGRLVSSRILKAQTGFSNAGFSVYPNPVTDDRFSITLAAVQKGTYKLRLVNVAGVCVQTTSIHLQGDGITQLVSFPGSVNAGTYIVSLTGSQYQASRLVVKK